MEGRIAIRDVRVELDDRVAAIASIHGATGLAFAAKIEVLPVRRGDLAGAEPSGGGLAMQGFDQASEGTTVRLLAHVPDADRGQRAARRNLADLGHAAEPDVGGLGDQRGQEGAPFGMRASRLHVAEHIGEARPSVDFLKEIGDSHARQQSIQPTGEHTCLWIIFGLRLRQRQPIAIEDRTGALTGCQLLRHLQKSPVEKVAGRAAPCGRRDRRRQSE